MSDVFAWPVAVVMVASLVLVALTGFLRFWIAHLERKMSAAEVNRIEELDGAIESHKTEMKLVVAALSDKLTQLANRRQ